MLNKEKFLILDLFDHSLILMESHIGEPWVTLVVLKLCGSSPLQASLKVGFPTLA